MLGTKIESLDAGLGRLSEFHITLLIPTRFDEERLRNAAYLVGEKYPETNYWTDLLRRRVFPLHGFHDDLGYFKCRYNKKELKTVVPSYNTSDMVSLDSRPVDQLFRGWFSLKQSMFQRLLNIQAVIFQDGFVLRVKVQHVLCDAEGLYKIVQSYVSFLESPSPQKPVPSTLFQREYRLKTSQNPPMDSERVRDAVLRHNRYYAKGIDGLIAAGLRSWLNYHKQKPHSKRTVFVPRSRFDSWGRTAETTDNDILMGWLHHAVAQYIDMFKLPSTEREHFAFVMGLNLENKYDFSNPYLLVPVSMTQGSILDFAVHVRATLKEARHTDVCQGGMNFHDHLHRVPLIPKDHGTSKTVYVFATSWMRQKWYDLSVSPVYVQGTIELMPVLRMLKVRMPNEVACWKGRDGFWIEGELPDDLWSLLLRG